MSKLQEGGSGPRANTGGLALVSGTVSHYFKDSYYCSY